MRCIISLTSHGHCGFRRSQQIESLAFSNPNRCDEHYQRRHWFTATSCDHLPSRLQHCPLLPPPSDNNQDNNDDDDDDKEEEDDGNDEDDKDDDNSNDEDDDNDNENEDDINKEDKDDSDGDNDDDNNEDNNDQYNYNSNGNYIHFLSKANKDSDNEDSDKEDSEDEDSLSDNDVYNEAASLVECLHTQLSIVWRLIVVLGPHFQVSYSPIAHPDFCVITTLHDCYHYWGV